jgi:hypothetical protein
MGWARSSLLRRSFRRNAATCGSRFWVEVGLSGVSFALLVLTLVVPDWIEAVFRVSPDRHSGSLEWSIDGLLLAAAVTAGVLARLDWQRPRPVSSDLN